MSASPLSREFASDIEIRSNGDGRTIFGIVVPFGRVATVNDGRGAYRESFQQGAFAKHLSERSRPIPLLGQHESRKNPLGVSSLLREDASGLYGEFKVSKTTRGDEAIELARDGAMAFSVGFTPIKDVKRGGVTVRTETGLRETSLVTFAAYEDALVGGVRSEDDLSEPERQAVEALITTGYTREDAVAFVLSHELRSTTPETEPGSAGTPEGAAPVDEPAHATPLEIRFRFQAEMRKRGIRA